MNPRHINIYNSNKSIIIINDHMTIKGGADRVAISQFKYLKDKSNSCDIRFLSSYKDRPIKTDKNLILVNEYHHNYYNFHKNIFNFKIFILVLFFLFLNKSKKIIVIGHSWTKQLSPVIFLLSIKHKFFLYLHDYFLFCPNGGFYNYHISKKCDLVGGSFQCFKTNCDKKSYIVKIYRFLRFYFMNLFIFKNKMTFIYLNNYQKQLLRSKKNGFNAIYQPNPISFNPKKLLSKKYHKNFSMIYAGRADPEKGIDLIMFNNFPNHTVHLFTDKYIISDQNFINHGWSDLNKIRFICDKENALFSLFTSRWYEVDPLTPYEHLSIGLIVLSFSDNLFGKKLLKKGYHELVFSSSEALDELISTMTLRKYNYLKNLSVKFYKEEFLLRSTVKPISFEKL